jgi:inosine triphosphate pyrophosphatase
LFDQACLYTDSRETVITCYDLVIPDPTVADLLASIRVSSSSNVVPYHSSEPVTKKAKHSSALPAITFVSDQDPNIAQVARLLQPNDANGGLVYSLRFVNKALPRLQGDIMELAQEKCRIAAQHVNGAVITEDTALCFTALHGLPGPYINFFLESCGVDGLHKMIEAYDDKTAYAQTVVCFCIRPGHEPVVFEGRTHGTIVAPRGTVALDWDAIFEPAEGGGKAFAEMKNNERDALSHRGQALVQLREYLNKFVKSSDLC